MREHGSENWDVLSLPAIAEHNESFRREGEALWPERFPLEDLKQKRQLVGGAAWRRRALATIASRTQFLRCRVARDAKQCRCHRRSFVPGSTYDSPAFISSAC